MKVTLYMAISVNGMIARKNGEEDFLTDANWRMFFALAKERGNFIYGSKTYEAVRAWGPEYSFDALTDVEKIVISRDPAYVLDKGFTLANSPKDALEKLTRMGLTDVLVSGGSTINSEFAKENLIDEVILNIEPVFIGSGIGLFSSADFDLKAEVISSERTGNLLTLHYRILK